MTHVVYHFGAVRGCFNKNTAILSLGVLNLAFFLQISSLIGKVTSGLGQIFIDEDSTTFGLHLGTSLVDSLSCPLRDIFDQHSSLLGSSGRAYMV